MKKEGMRSEGMKAVKGMSALAGRAKAKKLAAVIAAAMLAAGLTACGGNGETSDASASGAENTEAAESADSGNSAAETSDGSYSIGIGQFAEHGSLDNCREGFILGLAEEGIKEGENLKITYNNANADGSIASQINQSYVGSGVDLICSIATPMAQSAYAVTKNTDVPIIYTAVTDPVAAELVDSEGMPVGNISGTSDKLPVEEQLKMIRKILPDAKKLGIMYTTSEVNSESSVEEYKELAADYGFEIVESGISTSADIPLAADTLLNEADCVTMITDNTVVASLPIILSKANAKNIPVFGSEIEQVKKGCLASMGLDYIELGKQTGRMAAKVLKGEAKASDMKYELIEGASFYGNTKVAENLGIELPAELTESAVEMFDSITE